MSSDPFNSPFGGGNGKGTPDPQNPFQIVNEERPVGGAVPSPFETSPEESPFGIAPSVKPAAGGPVAPAAGANPFRSQPKESEAKPESPREGGFEMTGMKAETAPVGNLETAPIGGSASAAAASPYAKTEAAADPFASARPAATVPAPQERKEVPAAKAAPAAPARVPAKPSSPINMKQLELRAIFGVDHELSPSEMLQKARGLPGVLNLASVSGHNLDALETLKSCIDGLGFASSDSIALNCPDGLIEFVSYGNTALAVLREGDYAPGVRETLIIIARELDQE